MTEKNHSNNMTTASGHGPPPTPPPNPGPVPGASGTATENNNPPTPPRGTSRRRLNLRRAHKKSHLGCANCKQRRIKCNEQLPICAQCAKSKLKCSYLNLSEQEIRVRTRNQAMNPEWSVPMGQSQSQQQGANAAMAPMVGPHPQPAPFSGSTYSGGGLPPIQSHPQMPSVTTSGPARLIPAPVSPGHGYNIAGMTSNFLDTQFGSVQLPPIMSQVGSLPPQPPSTHHQHHPHQSSQPPPPPPPPPPPHSHSHSHPPAPAVATPPQQPQQQPQQQREAIPQMKLNPSKSVQLPSITQSVVLPAMDNPALIASQIPLFRQGFETDNVRTAYMDWLRWIMLSACDNGGLYHAVMALSYGFLASKTGHEVYKYGFDKHRYIALHSLKDVLSGEKVVDPDSLLAASVVLSFSIFSQDENLLSFATLAKGFAAVLERVQSVTPTTYASSMTIALIQGVKALSVPPYDSEFFYEVASKIRSIEGYIRSAGVQDLNEHYDDLIKFVERVLEFLQNNRRSFHASWSGASYYSPKQMFLFLKDWFKIMPPMASSTLLPETPFCEQAVVLFAYFHCVTKSLDALFPEVRYIFQFGFIGPTDLAAVESFVSLFETKMPNTVYLLSYPLKVLMFFKERLFIISRIMQNCGMNETPPIKEVFVKSFVNTPLTSEHYPSAVPSDNGKESKHSSPTDSLPKDLYKYYLADRMEVLRNVDL
uniref:ARAD1B17182p n=1 Tax=Blastobotrys adeninivorans TaxID=409370 RepID=A0A060T6P9_BLAAD